MNNDTSRKPRILAVGEFSQLATGYSTYYMELLTRLHNSGKYEIAELACFTNRNDPRISILPWKVFPNHPAGDRQEENDKFAAKQSNNFGEFRFEEVCLQFKPDIVFDIRDHWMLEFEERSPFRDFYRWVIMPTVDASPQHEQWLATYANADAVFTYSDWGTEILRQEGGGLINTMGSTPPGADLETFRPMDRRKLRSKYHFEDDTFIIGTVMRNQGRKCYPELIQAFATFLESAPAYMAKKTYLYLHTSYPDQGWDIPRLIKKYGVSHKVLVTYKCTNCHAVFPSFFMDAKGSCDDCGKPTAQMPNVHQGVGRHMLANIINLFDCYVQYANSEGFGMPMVEAASCGVPVFATDYSAMSDVVRKVKGYPIKVESFSTDTDFGCQRARPDNKDLVEKLIKFFSLSEEQRFDKGKQAREAVEKHYTWEQTAKKWMAVFDTLLTSQTAEIPNQFGTTGTLISGQKKSLETTKDAQTGCLVSSPMKKRPLSRNTLRRWNSPPCLHRPKYETRNFESNEELVRWAILNVLGQPKMLNSYLSLRLIRDLNWGLAMKDLSGGNYHNEQSVLATQGKLTKFTAEDMIHELTLICEYRNLWESRRWEMVQDSN